jgi:alanine-synthesizing transaminase
MFKKIIPARRTELVTYAIRDIVVKAKKLEAQGKKILYLNIGDPPVYDFETPRQLRQIVVDKILNSNAGARLNVSTYADSMGIGEARQAVAQYATEKKGNKRGQCRKCFYGQRSFRSHHSGNRRPGRSR